MPQDGIATLTAIIVDDDAVAFARLRRALQELGYSARQAEDTQAALLILSQASAPVITFFEVNLPHNRMAGLDHADLLGALLSDADLASRHAFVVVSRTPDTVAMSLGRLLDRLAVPILVQPSPLGALREVIALAVTHLTITNEMDEGPLAPSGEAQASQLPC